MQDPNPLYIFIPALVLVFWTFCILLLIPIRRIAALRSKQVRYDDFKLGESGRVPEHVCVANRNYMNLLELPLLFYFGLVFAYLTESVSETSLWLASLYTFNRVLHSIVHVSYNKVYHRFLLFGFSNVLLISLWIKISIDFAARL